MGVMQNGHGSCTDPLLVACCGPWTTLGAADQAPDIPYLPLGSGCFLKRSFIQHRARAVALSYLKPGLFCWKTSPKM